MNIDKAVIFNFCKVVSLCQCSFQMPLLWNTAEMFDRGNEKMLVTVGCGIFPPSDSNQVRGQG